MRLILYGYKCCGKTTLGKALSQALACAFIDTDQCLLQHPQARGVANISALYQQLGEQAFRQLESMVLSELSPPANAIIATGGGAVLAGDNVKQLRALGQLVYLQVPMAVLLERLSKLEETPAFLHQHESKLTNYLRSRTEYYQSIADYTVEAGEASVDALVQQLLVLRQSLKQARA